jgi:hypothetical protein
MTNQWAKIKKAQKTKWSRQYPAIVKPAYLTYEEIVEIARDRESGLDTEQAKKGQEQQDK